MGLHSDEKGRKEEDTDMWRMASPEATAASMRTSCGSGGSKTAALLATMRLGNIVSTGWCASRRHALMIHVSASFTSDRSDRWHWYTEIPAGRAGPSPAACSGSCCCCGAGAEAAEGGGAEKGVRRTSANLM